MILKELYELYKRLIKRGEEVPRENEWKQNVGLVIVLTPDGKLVDNNPVRYIGTANDKGKYVSVPLFVLSRDKTNKVEPGFLCDKLENILGVSAKFSKSELDKVSQAEKYRAIMPAKYEKVLSEFEVLRGTGLAAVVRFICDWKPESLSKILTSGIRQDDFVLNTVFQIQGKENYIHQEDEIQEWWKRWGFTWWYPVTDVMMSQCLITGKIDTIAQTHVPRLSGMGGKPTTLVSCNKANFNSYGKEQCNNAPVSIDAASSYCKALDFLLSSKLNCIQIAGLTMVFWTDILAKDVDESLVWLAGSAIEPDRFDRESAEDSRLPQQIKEDLLHLLHGRLITREQDKENSFFILGLSPNEGRVAVRYFFESTYGDFISQLREHYSLLDLRPFNVNNDKKLAISPYMILKASTRLTENERDIYKIIRDYAAVKKIKLVLEKDIHNKSVVALMQSVLYGAFYPDSLAIEIITRIKLEGRQQITKHSGYFQIRCAYLKAWLSRKNKSYIIKTMLDIDNKEKGYVLGRLFAVFQQIQKEAYSNGENRNGENRNGVNRTIMDSFYASASTTPMRVFPHIIKMNHHHLHKLGADWPGKKILWKKQIQEIVYLINEFPEYLTLEQQGLFALGFYHQTREFYTATKQEQ